MLSHRELSALARTLADVIERHVALLADSLGERLAQVEARIEKIPAGPKGEKGDTGADGAAGLEGLSAYELAVAHGCELDEKAWLDSLQGPAGPAGPPGASIEGPPGAEGRAGDPGPSAYDLARAGGYSGSESEWLASLRGEAGPPGPAGPAGAPGEPGEAGRDALALDILPVIDETRRYPRGAYARHRGGLWRAHAQTEGLRGWECLVEGIAEIVVMANGERGWDILIEHSGGAQTTASVTLPVMIYREIYQAGAEYQPGDVVTWAGSAWVAKETTRAKPGEADSGWQLAVKRGRDGRHGEKGERGEPGPAGRAGRDLTQMAFDGQKYR